jgi:hypothetical protein
MSASDFNLIIDNENDVFYIVRKDVDNSTTINLDVSADTTIRLDRRTHDVIGFTITDYSKSVFGRLFTDKSEYEIAEKFDLFVNTLNAMHRGLEHQNT